MFTKLVSMRNPNNNDQISFPATDFANYLSWTPGIDGDHMAKYKMNVVLNPVNHPAQDEDEIGQETII